MKKLLSIVFCVFMVFSAFALVGCGNAELLRRIDELEQEINNIRELEGIPGPQGPVGPTGPQGPTGSDCKCTAVELNRIYQLGETFTYVNGNLELFRVRVWSPEPNAINITVTIVTMPWFRLDDFIRGRTGIPNTNDFLNFSISLSNAGLHIGESVTHGITYALLRDYVWFGTPAGNVIIPFVRFSIK